MQTLFLLDQTQELLILCYSTVVAFLVVSELENLPLFKLVAILKAIASAASKFSCEDTSMTNIESGLSKKWVSSEMFLC